MWHDWTLMTGLSASWFCWLNLFMCSLLNAYPIEIFNEPFTEQIWSE